MMQVPVVGFLSQQRSFDQFLITLEQEFGPGPINSTMVQPCTLDPQPSTLNPERKLCGGVLGFTKGPPRHLCVVSS